MKHPLLSTLALGALALGLAAPAAAQLDRASGDNQDVIWARDIGSATITLDGAIDEPEWAQAEKLAFKWDAPLGGPGSGQYFQENPNGFTDPVDPSDATLSFLRKGNDLYIALDAKDTSIGGESGLWDYDGLIMALINKFDRPDDFSMLDDYFVPTREEAFFGWYNRGQSQDTTAAGDPIPGVAAYGFLTSFGGRYDTTAVTAPSAFDFGATVDGLANDDFNGNAAFTADVGYTLELRISVDSLGWDLTEALSRMPISIGLQDTDYKFGSDGAANPNYSLSRVWWQGRWGNVYSDGIAYIGGDPSVTVSSGALPAYTEPEFRVGNANNTDDLVVDGKLDDDAWTQTNPAFSFNYQPTPAELDNGLSGVVAPYYMFYFHPGDNEVIDPTEGRIHMLYQGSKLYFGLDTDDAAINGQEGENGRDGFRIRIRSLDSLTTGTEFSLETLRMDISIDSTGAPRVTNNPEEIVLGENLKVAVGLKGSSTVANAEDIDTGYQIEVELDLESIGYPEDLGGEEVWVSFAYFDSDALQVDAQSTTYRAWTLNERDGGASIMGYLDPNVDLSVSSEGGASERVLRSLGSAPNPSSGLTRLRYELPTSADVTVEVFDVLGRLVQTVEAGPQPEGRQSVEIDGASLGAGTYLYRVSMEGGESVTGRLTIVR